MNILKSISPRATHFDYIDGLKGIAVLMVLWHHGLIYFKLDFNYDFIRAWIDNGSRGVQLFFMISGFTLYNSSLKRFVIDEYPRLSFYLRRAFRILPFYWLNILYVSSQQHPSFSKILLNATFVYGFIDMNQYIVPGTWSLFVEEIFYVTFPLVFIRFYKKLPMVLFFLILALLVRAFFFKWTLDTGRPIGEVNFWGSPLFNFFWFYAGILLAHLNINRHHNRVSNNLFLLEFVAVLGIASIVYLDEIFISLIFGVVIYLATFTNTIFGKVCRLKWLRSIGICSYSFYFIHFYVINNFNNLLFNDFNSSLYKSLPTEFKFIFYVVCLGIVTQIISIISFLLIESPSVKLGAFVISKINHKDFSKKNISDVFISLLPFRISK